MNLTETGAALAKCSAYDNREASTMAIQAWHEALGDLAVGDVLTAIAEHYRDSTAFLMPGRVRELVKASQRAAYRRDLLARAKAKVDEIKACDLCDDSGYRLPLARRVCTHAELVRVDATAQLRAIRGGES